MEQGLLQNVHLRTIGSTADGDLLAGATDLPVSDASDFEESGGDSILVEGNAYVVSSVTQGETEDDEDILHLTSALVADVESGTEVAIQPVGQEMVGLVQLEDSLDDAIECKIRWDLQSQLPEGIREPEDQEQVTVDIVDGRYTIVGLDGSVPVIQSAYLDVPIGGGTDGEPPVNTPILSVLPGIESLFLVWAMLDPTGDPVTYEVHLYDAPGAALDNSNLVTETMGTQFVATRLADGTPLVAGQTYYATLIASDPDGSAAPSAEASGSPVEAADPAVLADNVAQLETLNTTTIPGINADLTAAETDISNLQGLFPITSTSISDGAITTPKMTANSINGDRITANTLNASKIVSGTITTALMTANTINGDRILVNSLNADKIVANSITAGQIAALTITASLMAANTITATQIAAGTITATEIAGSTITAAKIAGGTITAAQIAAGTITGDRVAAGAITADKLSLQSTGSNAVRDWSMDNLGTWNMPTGWAFSGTTAPAPGDANSKVMRFTASGVYSQCSEPKFPCSPGDVFTIKYYIRRQGTAPTNGSVGLLMQFFDSTGASISTAVVDNTAATFTNANWVFRSGTITAPAGTVTATVNLRATATVDSGSLWDFDLVKVYPSIRDAGMKMFNAAGEQTVNIDANTGNASFIGEIGTALPGDVGIFLYSTQFSYLGTMVTRPTMQFNIATDGDQPNIAADTLGSANLYINSGRGSASRETQVFVGAGEFYVGIESAVNDGLYRGAFLDVKRDFGQWYTDQVFKSNAWRGKVQLDGSATWIGYEAPDSGWLRGFQALSSSGMCKALTDDSFQVVNPNSTSYQPLVAEKITSTANGIFMNDLSGGGSTGATINNSGRIVRTSTIRMKEAVEPMTETEAKSVLNVESFTGRYKKEPGLQADPRRYPMFIAEQAAEAGAELWVGRQHKVTKRDDMGVAKSFKRDKNGEIIYYRTAEMTVAHNWLLRDLYRELEDLRDRVASLEASSQ